SRSASHIHFFDFPFSSLRRCALWPPRLMYFVEGQPPLADKWKGTNSCPAEHETKETSPMSLDAAWLESWAKMYDLWAGKFKKDFGAFERYFEGLSAQTKPGVVATAGGIAVGALPVITQVGVFMALGAGYMEARSMARDEENLLGFSHGF